MKLKISVTTIIGTVFVFASMVIFLFAAYQSTNELYPTYSQNATNFTPGPTYGFINAAVGTLIMGCVSALCIAGYSLEKDRLKLELAMANNTTPVENIDIPVVSENVIPVEENVYLAPDITLPKKRVIEFVEESMKSNGPRLAIGQWRTRGWTQREVEATLDMLHNIGLCTKRSVGKQCIYINAHTPENVLRRISLSV